MLKRVLSGIAVCIVWTGAAWAGNGHLLHGVLPINSAMGGSGVGIPTGVISAMHYNPALITRMGYIRFETGTEFFKDDLSATSVTASGVRRTTKSIGEVGVLPAVAFSVHPKDKKFAFGWSLMAVAGFRANWPADPQNLMLAPLPVGFGRLNTELAMTKVTFTFAYDVLPNLSVGLSAVLFQGRLVVTPNPVVEPDISEQGNFVAYRPTVSVPSTKYGPTGQLGVYYELNPKFSVGASFTPRQSFDEYSWVSTHANPLLANFDTDRTVTLKIDGPPVISLGFGIRPTPKLKLALDGRWVGYKNTQGIGKAPDAVYKGTTYEGTGGGITPPNESQVGPRGPIPRFALVSIGWQNILIGMLGAEYDISPRFKARAGINLNQSPIKEAITLNSGGTPSVFNQHYAGGFSASVTENFALDFGFYYTPKVSKTGPFIPGQTGPLPSITLTDGIVSALLGFTASF
ncbi:MAG: outer membrane protein transport protein [candidate division Zixibacteria bacterium]|nr:outer membrane protein transport protein [candidate division Zixibacteria bacterium]